MQSIILAHTTSGGKNNFNCTHRHFIHSILSFSGSPGASFRSTQKLFQFCGAIVAAGSFFLLVLLFSI